MRPDDAPPPIVCRADAQALFEAAARAGALSLADPWMYMYSVGPAHYFKHQVTRRYRIWRGEPPRVAAAGEGR
jgi:hypothetical protein